MAWMKMKNTNVFAIVLLAVGLGSLALGVAYSAYTVTSNLRSAIGIAETGTNT